LIPEGVGVVQTTRAAFISAAIIWKMGALRRKALNANQEIGVRGNADLPIGFFFLIFRRSEFPGNADLPIGLWQMGVLRDKALKANLLISIWKIGALRRTALKANQEIGVPGNADLPIGFFFLIFLR
jgi:hypothetical protein